MAGGSGPVDRVGLDAAVRAITDGELVVYPTETVYGLGADALDPAAVERVFAAKRRDSDQPVSMAVHDVGAIDEYATLSERERAFCEAFLPGPVTVVVAARDRVPRRLTGGRARVGVRVPDHGVARALAERAGPITATSANVSGRPSVRRVADLDDEIRDAAATVLDGGETPGGGSTVVDVVAGEISRRGAQAEAVAAWLGGDDRRLD
jgi:L-threonylcarbamoyladenylate synthase